MKSTQGAGLIGDEALDFLAILSLPDCLVLYIIRPFIIF